VSKVVHGSLGHNSPDDLQMSSFLPKARCTAFLLVHHGQHRGDTLTMAKRKESASWTNHRHGHGLKALVLLISASEKRGASNGGWLTYLPTKGRSTLFVIVNEGSWKHALTRHQHGSRIYAQNQSIFCRFRRTVTLTLTSRQFHGSRLSQLTCSLGVVRLPLFLSS